MRNFLIILGLILIGIFAFVVNDYINAKNTIKGIKSELSSSRDSSRKFIDLYGSLNTELETQIINRQSSEILYKKLIDSQAKRLSIKPKQIVEHTTFTAQKEGVLEFTLDELDSIIAHNKKEPDTIKDSGSQIIYIPYSENTDFTINKYWKKRKVLGIENLFFLDKHWFVDIYSEDKDVKIYKFKNISIADEYSGFSIAATLGMTVPNLRPVAVIGISYSPKFLRFKKRK